MQLKLLHLLLPLLAAVHSSRLPFELDPRASSLVVIGAHHFGRDANDPTYESVRDLPWKSTVLVEASPTVATELDSFVRTRNPTPKVPVDHVHVVRGGVIPGNRSVAPRNMLFYTFDTDALPGLPFWATQIGSFNRFHVLKLLPTIAQSKSASRYPPRTLRSHVKAVSVHAKPLELTLSDSGVSQAGLMIIDTEGLDCSIVASQKWGSSDTCWWRPNILIFERFHCLPRDYLAARAALLNAAECPPRPGHRDSTKYVAVDERHDSGQNAVFALKPTLREGRWIEQSWLKWLGSEIKTPQPI